MKKQRIHIPLVATTLILTLLSVWFDPSLRGLFTFHAAKAVGESVGIDVLGQTNGDAPYFDSNFEDDDFNAVQLLPEDIVLDADGHRLFVSEGQTKGRILVFDLDSSNNLIDHVADAVLGTPDFKTMAAGLGDAVFSTGPLGMAYDGDTDRLFVADSANNRVLIFDTADIDDGESAVNVLGQLDFSTNGTGTDEFTMDTPTGLAYDVPGKRLFVSDRGNNRVLVFNLLGGTTDGMPASNVLGQPNFGSNGNATTQSGLFLAGTFGVVPELVYVPSTGSMPDSLFVSDYNNARVMVFDVDTIGDGEPAANVLGASNFTTGIGGTTSASNVTFHTTGLTYDPTQEVLYVSDDVNRILLFDLSDGVTDGEPAFDVIGQPSFTGQNPYCPNDSNNDICAYSIDGPEGLEFDPGNDRLYVATNESERVSIFEGADDGTPPPATPPLAVDNLGQMDGAENPVFDNTAFRNAYGMHAPESVALDEANHRLFVADTANNRVLMFDLSVDNEVDDRAAAVSFGQTQVFDYAPSESNPICATEFFRSGDANNGASGGFFGECGDNSVNEAGFNTPSGLAYDAADDRLFVTDSGNNRVLVFQGPFSSGMGATYVLGQTDFTGSSPDVSATQLDTPKDVDYDSSNQRLFVADSGNDRVVIYDLSGGISNGMAATGVLGAADLDTQGSGGLNPPPDTVGGPEGVTYDANNDRLFVADYFRDRVVVYDLADLVPPGSGLTPQSHVLGQEDFDGYGPRGGQDGLNFTNCSYCVSNLHMAYDLAEEQLLVPDRFNHRIMVFDVAPGTIADGEDASDVVGQSNFDDTNPDFSQNRVDMPQGIARDSTSGNIFIADTNNNRVMIFGPAAPPPPPVATGGHEATDLLGELNGSDEPNFEKNKPNNGPNSEGLYFPHDFAIDPNNHRLFLADGANSRIMVFDLDASDHLLDHVADNVLGEADLFEDRGDCTNDRIVDPHGLAYDSTTDRLFMSDSCGSGRVVVWDLSGGLTDGMAASWVLGAEDFGGSEVATAQNDVNRPSYMALDEAGQRLFVGDPGNARVLVFDIADITSGEDAVNVLGQEDFTSNSPGLDQDSLGFSSGFIEMGLAYDANNNRLFVADLANHRTMVFDVNPGTITDGEDADNVLGQETFFTDVCDSSPDGQCEPVDAAYDDATDRLFVSDSNNTRVLVYNLSGGISDGMDATNVIGEEDFDTNTSQTTQDGFAEMRGILFDPVADYLYVAEFGNVRGMIFDVATVDDGEDAVDMVGELDDAGSPKYTKNGPHNGPNVRGMGEPDYVALDHAHQRVFVSDYDNNRILVFNTNADMTLPDHIADLVIGQTDFTSGAPDTSATGLRAAEQVWYDETNDRLFVADTGNNRVLVFDGSAVSNGMAASEVIGQNNFSSGDCNRGVSPDSDTLCGPHGVSFDPLNNFLVVADSENNRVLVYDVSGGVGDGMPADVVLGQQDFISNGSGTTDNTLNFPVGVLADSTNGNNVIWVADTGNNRALAFDLDANTGDSAHAVIGQSDYTSNDAGSGTTGMSGTQDFTISGVPGTPGALLYVSELNNNRVLVFDYSDGIDDGEAAIDAYGQPNFSDNDCVTSQSGLCSPVGIQYDNTNSTLWVGEDNNRITIFGPAAPTPTPTPTSTPAHGGHPSPTGFHPDRIVINDDDATVRGRNVLVTLYATVSDNFAGDVQVLISNDPTFGTTIPFDYHIPETNAQGSNQDAWPKIVPWDMCFGLTSPCDPGTRTVYARFYVNKSQVRPALTPRPAGLQ